MTNDQIKEIALANGFKLKEQPDGSQDLNPYVYDFARLLFAKAVPVWMSVDVPPALFEEVLLRYHAHYLHEQVTEFDCCTGYYNGKRFVAKDQIMYQRRTVQVTHWMPLPKPPSEVNDES